MKHRDRGFFLPMSEELLKRMRAAAERVDRAREFLCFDGTTRGQWGRNLATEREDEYAARQKPLRTWRDLEPAEIAQLLEDAKLDSVQRVAQRHHVHPDTVEYLVSAVATGFLVSA